MTGALGRTIAAVAWLVAGPALPAQIRAGDYDEDAIACYQAAASGRPVSAQRACQAAAWRGDGHTVYLLAVETAAGGAHDEAAALLEQAAAGGHVRAMALLAQWLERGWEGRPANPQAARRWRRRAAAAGDGPSRIALGRTLRGGTARQQTQARRLYAAAAAQGFAAAGYELAAMLVHGRGGPADPIRARALLTEAAISGHPGAQFELGILLYRERPVRALRWLRLAALRGNPVAMERLARLLAEGRGTGTAPERAAYWAQRAVRAGHPAGLALLAAVAQPTEPRPAAARGSLVAAVQKGLAGLGYDSGPVDGIAGERTAAAIRAFQRDAGVPVDGRISAELVARLEAAAAE